MSRQLSEIIKEQTEKALWEVKNVIECVPGNLWDKCYCEMPMWQHIYHMLHSLDLWFINPNDPDFVEPDIHKPQLNNLDIKPNLDDRISPDDMINYYYKIKKKINSYLDKLSDNELSEKPDNCAFEKLTLIIGQYRHLYSHIGMIMGFIIDDAGLWPYVIGITREIPKGSYDKYF